MHAVVIAACGIYLTFMTDTFDTDLWGSFPPLLDYAFPVYLGYSLYDMGTMVFQTNHWTLWAHHIFVRFTLPIRLVV